MENRWRKRSAWKGIVAGLAGGIAGAYAMNQFQKGWSKAQQKLNGNRHSPRSSDEPDATMLTANKVARPFLHRELTRDEQKKAAPIVHYAFAAAVGSGYGAAAEYKPVFRKFGGVPFGAALFGGADELAVPLFKLSKHPKEYPLSSHLYGLASHIVYGATIEAVRRGVRAALGS